MLRELVLPDTPGYLTMTDRELAVRVLPMSLGMVLFMFLGLYETAGFASILAFICLLLVQAYGTVFGPPDPTRVRLQYAWLNGNL